MRIEDMSERARVRRLERLTLDLRRCQTPDETLRAFQRGFADEGESTISLLLSTRGVGPGRVRVVPMRGVSPLDAEGRGALTLPIVRDGPLSTILSKPAPQLIHDLDWSSESYFRPMLAGYSSAIAVPFSAERLPVNWMLLLKKAPHQLTAHDLEETLERVAVGGALLENQMLAAQLARAHEQIDREARQVGELQRALLPTSPPQIAGLDLAASYEPSGRAGGDLYDVFRLDDVDVADGPAESPGRWCILIGDATGHGLAAAVVAAVVQTVLRVRPAGVDGAADLVRHVNRQLCARRIGGFFTAFLAVYEPAARTLTYANAGHPAPLLRRAADGDVFPLGAALNLPLGILEAEAYSESTLRLDRGDTVLMYTDGITEARDDGGTMLSPDRLVSIFGVGADRPEAVLRHVREAVRSHSESRAAADDQTLVVARVL